MKKIEIEELQEDLVISEEEIKHVKGGLLPASNLTQKGIIAVYPKVEIDVDKLSHKIY